MTLHPGAGGGITLAAIARADGFEMFRQPSLHSDGFAAKVGHAVTAVDSASVCYRWI
jgi:hypothetical protein